jgi:hypothetical protein
VEPWRTQKNDDDLFVCISAVRESLLTAFRKNHQLFLEPLASIGINDIVVQKAYWGAGGHGGQKGDGAGGQEEVVFVLLLLLLLELLLQYS